MTRHRAPLLIMCAPRSFSSVTAAMLGQHPDLYGFPELNLFIADRLDELSRFDDAQGQGRGTRRTGLLRAVSELASGGQTEAGLRHAERWARARSHWRTDEVFTRLLEWVAPRIGIDKSPRTAMSRQAIERALAAFPGARIVHLTRHPVACVRSMCAAHVRAVPSAGHRPGLSVLAQFYAEAWLEIQRNIVETRDRLDEASYFALAGEQLLARPRECLGDLAAWLGVRSDPAAINAMLRPDRSPYARPSPGGLTGDGDDGFHLSPRLRIAQPSLSSPVPQGWNLPARLLQRIDEMSRHLGLGSAI